MADTPTTAASTKARARKRLVLVLVGVIVLSFLWFIWKLVSRDPNYDKVRIVDQANRFVLDYEQGIYLIGVEVPPRQEATVGAKGYDYVNRRVFDRYIRIVPGKKRADDAGWILGYVYYTGDDGKEHFLNEELLRLGYGRLRLEFPNDKDFRPLFEAAQAEAKEKKLGIWQDGYVFPGR